VPEAILPSYNIFSRFFIAWYFKLGSSFYVSLKGLIRDTNYLLAPFTMLRFLLVPLFGDYTWQGVIIGILFRLVRALIGFMVLGTLLLFAFIALAAWYVLPCVAIFFAVRNLLLLALA
jgi:hypothetical protein